MSAETLATKYIAAMEKTIQTLKLTNGPINVSKGSVDEIFGYVKAYLDDAKFFVEQKKYETALTSIAYCEGLLDALKLMGAIEKSSQD